MSRPAQSFPPLLEATGPARDRALARAPQAEWGLAHQGAQVLLGADQSTGWLVRRAGRRLVALGMPLGPAALGDLARTASARGLSPLIYKCDATTACAARRQGWRVLRLGHEAVLDPRTWIADRPACRQLRRKLRSVGKVLRIEEARHLPFDQMENVSREWVARSGAERGFSMGRLDPRLLRHQRVLLAWQGEALVAFASFHANASEWTLDLMRHAEGAPNGTMHRLVAEAIALARAEGAHRFSLAAIPPPPILSRWRSPRPCGLSQFKLSFGPRLEPRYAAASGRASLLTGLARVAVAIHRPGPLRASPRLPARWTIGRHDQYAFEPKPIPCDARPATATQPERSRLT